VVKVKRTNEPQLITPTVRCVSQLSQLHNLVFFFLLLKLKRFQMVVLFLKSFTVFFLMRTRIKVSSFRKVKLHNYFST